MRTLLCVILLADGAWSGAHAAEPIRVGTAQSLSGRFATEGGDQLKGLQMWVDDLNARGQLLGRRVELVWFDDRSDPARVADLYRRLVEDEQVDLLIGPYSSELSLVATEVAEAAAFPIVTAAASANRIWERGYRNVFGIDVPSSNYMDIAVTTAAQKGARTAALFYGTGDFAADVARGVRRELDRHGLKLLLDRQYDPEDASDLQQVARELLAIESQADVVFGATYLQDMVTIGRAFGPGRQLKVKMLCLTVGPASAEFGEQLGNNVDGVTGVVQWLRTVRLPKAQDFSYRYRQIHGRNPGVHSAIGYSAGQVIEAAVRLAGTTDRDALRDQLRSMRFRSLIGRYEVDDTGRQVGKQNYLLQWQDGQRRLVAPPSVAETALIYPRP
jgi:branched-chain amino acid transport system substrate-binding protein